VSNLEHMQRLNQTQSDTEQKTNKFKILKR